MLFVKRETVKYVKLGDKYRAIIDRGSRITALILRLPL